MTHPAETDPQEQGVGGGCSPRRRQKRECRFGAGGRVVAVHRERPFCQPYLKPRPQSQNEGGDGDWWSCWWGCRWALAAAGRDARAGRKLIVNHAGWSC